MFSRYIQTNFSRRAITPDGDIQLYPSYSIEWSAIARDLKRGINRRARETARWFQCVAVSTSNFAAIGGLPYAC
jgi:hypothetical protein